MFASCQGSATSLGYSGDKTVAHQTTRKAIFGNVSAARLVPVCEKLRKELRQGCERQKASFHTSGSFLSTIRARTARSRADQQNHLYSAKS
jgi:hypothetical protein